MDDTLTELIKDQIAFSEPTESFRRACWFSNIDEVQTRLKHGVDLTGSSRTYMEPLYYAGSASIVHLLREAGAGNDECPKIKLDILDHVLMENGIVTAVRVRWVEVVRALLETGCALEARDSTGRTRLMSNLSCGGIEAAKLLLDEGADPFAPQPYGATPLHELVVRLSGRVAEPLFSESLRLLHRLITLGANVNAVDSQGNTPLHCLFAFHRPNVDAARVLMASGADPLRGADGVESPMALAQSLGFDEIVAIFRG